MRVSVYESVVVAGHLRIARDPKESGPVGSRGVLPFLRSRKWDFMATELWNVANSERKRLFLAVWAKSGVCVG